LSSFSELNLIDPLLRAVAAAGYTEPTPIQERGIPALLSGRDVLGCAQTGTGKTAAFALPILQNLQATFPAPGRRPIRALVLSPTRELAAQIGECFAAYGKFLSLRHRVIYGGVGQGPQVDDLRKGVDILVATPGRLLDLHQQGHVNLSLVEFFVLDEADRMLDMGFIPDIRRIMKLLPPRRQNLLFSATLPDTIVSLAGGFLDRPLRIEVAPPATPVAGIVQHVLYVEKNDKTPLLAWLLNNRKLGMQKTLVFTRTKHGADKVVKSLLRENIEAAAIHGNKSQGNRERSLRRFQDGELEVLVATDLASRGLDVDLVTHVVNFDLPNEPESYVHRIGRTARAGREGVAFAFCGLEDAGFLWAIERLTGVQLTPYLDQPFHCEDAIPRAKPKPQRSPKHMPQPPQDRPRSRHPERRGPPRTGGWKPTRTWSSG